MIWFTLRWGPAYFEFRSVSYAQGCCCTREFALRYVSAVRGSEGRILDKPTVSYGEE